ncbi:class II aldolase/adducin family protein [Halalkalibacterium halodurans]|uniref:Ribulose phosphate epimerase n=1 Tax=Halalkalibacterium halodurans TaxID=86665 RepID=A0A0M0KL37_ALKHA|nr:class II aldolase/adducin family protein [Halalkalibacterium halodurans]MED4163383.1 class II aldolase/adducin family protein [Halalkalibacterium halodurans]TPE67913.1 class II aldolase/adducin family protein [Halalkalibacterium halodurans]
MKTFTFHGIPNQPFSSWLTEGMKEIFSTRGYTYLPAPEDHPKLVFHLADMENPRPYRRKSQATFVVTIIETFQKPKDIHKEAYPYLVRTLANHLMYVVHHSDGTELYFLTPEQGRYSIMVDSNQSDEEIFEKIFERLEPLASSRLVINNDFYEDLPEPLWEGDEVTESLSVSGKKLDTMNLLPAPFPLEEVLTPRDIRHLNRLYGIGGLSYGNLSARKDENNFWMSASGIDKSNMSDVGKDFLYISGYDEKSNAMKVSIPPKIKPKRASVDALEHWMIYREHPEVGAIVHIHAWMDGIQATQFNYPCGTLELAETVAQMVSESEDPSRTVIGLKNHGLTITGRDLDDIFERIDGKIIPQVPMD